MEFVMIFCFVFCAACTGVLTYHHIHKDNKAEAPFSDEEIGQIKQVLNMLTWGGEYENKD
jgi:hypothetical protein